MAELINKIEVFEEFAYFHGVNRELTFWNQNEATLFTLQIGEVQSLLEVKPQEQAKFALSLEARLSSKLVEKGFKYELKW